MASFDSLKKFSFHYIVKDSYSQGIKFKNSAATRFWLE